ncbi:glycosyltransferase family 2 protein [Geomonas sp. Red69]|uniref:glycosyltransferase family 2 protein n=1 Tax=Geomonas diazotrophica TaxID=2843197 RepID=UPI001C0F4CC5|nr:glycosyltransferase family 2 protein [Geomonas diazotrophica]MBU5637955.1 glycosyltransferase family 2 protein [Geomonas diazotrophica]
MIIPCYNESETIYEFYRRMAGVAEKAGDYLFEFIFVNDGSRDDTALRLNELSERDLRVKVVHLARNMGHQIAITAGMDFAGGDMVVIIDADLQDPPEEIPRMLEKIEQGFDLVHAQRTRRDGESGFKLATAWLFYKLMRRLSTRDIVENCGDFRAFNEKVLKVVRKFRERHRFMRGIFAIIGFRQCIIQYDRDRRYAGSTNYPFHKMLSLAINAILSFSSSPIRFITWTSFTLWAVSLIYLVKALLDHFVFQVTVPGWTSIIILMTFYNGIILFSIGIIGSYVGRTFEQAQGRPLYWVGDTRNIDREGNE